MNLIKILLIMMFSVLSMINAKSLDKEEELKWEHFKEGFAELDKMMEFEKSNQGHQTVANHNNLFKLGISYNHDKKYQKSVETLQKLENSYKKNSNKQKEYTTLLEWIANGYEKLQNYNKAQEYYQKALAIREKILRKEHIDTAYSYNNFGLFYQRMKDYPKAKNYILKSMNIYEKILGKEHINTAQIYNNLGNLYTLMDNNSKALIYYQKALSIRKKIMGEKHAYTEQSYYNIGKLYQKMGNYTLALSYIQKSLVIYEKTFGKEHSSTAVEYNNIGEIYEEIGDYKKALSYYQKSLFINKKILGQNHPSTATSYNNIGVLYYKRGNYVKALSNYQKSLAINEKVFGKEHINTARDYNNIASYYNQIGDYPEALIHYQKALTINTKILGKEHIGTALNHNNIASYYQEIGDYPKALIHNQEALAIREKILGKEHIDTASSYNNIGLVYHSMGDYPKALSKLQKALAIREKILGQAHIDTAPSYNNIGLVYHSMGDYHKALNYYKKALAIKEEILGEEHADTASSYNNIGALYYITGNYSNALIYYHKALSIRENILGKEHADTAESHNNLGTLYYTMIDYSKALRHYQEALAINTKILGKEHIDTASNYNNIGALFLAIGDYPKALSQLQKALAIREKILGKEHISTASSYNNISVLYQKMEDYPEAYHYAKFAFDIFLKSRDQVFTVLDNKQKEKYLKSTIDYIKSLLSGVYDYTTQLNKQKSTEEAQQIFHSGANAWLNYKGSIFDSENSIAMLYASTKNKELKAKIDNLVSSKRNLAKLYQSLPKPKEREAWKNNIKSTEEKIAKLTNEISSIASNFKEQQGLKSINYKDITSHLNDNELYIDYAKLGDVYYFFTLDHNEQITFSLSDVNTTKKIDSLVTTFRADVTTILNDSKITTNRLKHLTQSSKEKLSQLYELVINKPLGNTIANKSSVIISPDGALRLLPFEALYNKENNKYFIEEKEIRYIPSGKELVRLYKYSKDKIPNSKTNTVIFANPNFDTKIASVSKEEIAITPNTSRSGIIKSLFKMRFTPLPGTKAEAKAITATLDKKNISEYQTDKATESTLMKVKEPKILHIATHGFFINDNTIPNPMLKSGIALTGANASAIKGKSDGIVTALKLSGLDLKGTDLVVLSACETGVVDINSTDSVSGLSKAFIQAGAKDIVMSLWSVDDQATKELMTSFYQEMKENKNYAKALKAAKLKMIADGRHPFYWAAFVVSGL